MRVIVHFLVKFIRMFYVFISLFIRLLYSFNNEKILIKQGSKYNSSIIISECRSKRIMRFDNLSNGAQAQIDLNNIDYPCLEYIQLMIISLIYYPYKLNDKNILIIGLGGGIIPRSIRKLYPMLSITIIEIDPLVNEIAKKYFYFNEDLNMKVFINDGRNFLNTLSNSIKYDIILFDAYDSLSGLPNHMKTKEFFIQLKNYLNQNGGLFIINLVCIYQSYLNVRQTISFVFGEENLITFRSNDFVNMVLVASTFMDKFPKINEETNIINYIKNNLSIDVYSLLKRKQENIFQNNLSRKIYTDEIINNEYEQNMSFREFIDIV